MAQQRSIKAVSKKVLAALTIAIALQISFSLFSLNRKNNHADIPPPPSDKILTLSALGDKNFAATAIMLWLQSADNNTSKRDAYSALDYDVVQKWLDSYQRLSYKSSYAILMASQIYSMTRDDSKKRSMLEYVYKNFLKHPNRYWKWMIQSAIIAQHRLNDMQLALKYAEAVRKKTTSKTVPAWAKQHEVFIREDLGEYEVAAGVLKLLIDDNIVRDEKERIFLLEKLSDLQQENVEK